MKWICLLFKAFEINSNELIVRDSTICWTLGFLWCKFTTFIVIFKELQKEGRWGSKNKQNSRGLALKAREIESSVKEWPRSKYTERGKLNANVT